MENAFASMSKAQLEKQINSGKLEGATLKDAKKALSAKKAEVKVNGSEKKKKDPASAPKNDDKKKGAAKPKAAGPKTEKPESKEKTSPAPKQASTPKEGQNSGISELVRSMMTPQEGSTVCGCTYGEANRAVKEQFKRALYPSEFDRNFKKMVKDGILTEKQAPRYKKAAAEPTVQEAPVEQVVEETPETTATAEVPVEASKTKKGGGKSATKKK